MWLLAGLALLSLAACASMGTAEEPRRPPRPQLDERPASRAAQHAARMLGKPYRYGGSTPAGFDCSGLVLFSYQQAGIRMPRSTDEQRRASRPVRAENLQPGDLLFFDQEGKKNSHVGIYVGRGEFVHAPSSGKQVRSDRMDAPYWRKHLSEVRRVNV
jgi:cell wall-associated NlpC family hydrolase